MCGDVATPNLYVVAQQNCLQAPDTKTTVMGRRSGSSSSNDDVERADLSGLGKQGLDVFPYPLGPITDDAEAHLLCRNHASLFHLLEGLTELLLILYLMPTEHM